MGKNSTSKQPSKRKPTSISAVLIRKALGGESLSTAEWANIALTELLAAAILVYGRFLELGLLALDEEARPQSHVWAEFFSLITDQAHDQEGQLLEVMAKSRRAAELLPEVQMNRDVNRALSQEITTRSFHQSPATALMLVANPKSKAPVQPSSKMLEKVLEVQALRNYQSPDDAADIKQDAIAGAVEEFNEVWQLGWDHASDGREKLTEPPQMFSPTLDSKRWDRTEIYRLAEVWLSSAFQPIFFENPRVLPDAARQAYRDQFERRDAKKRGGTGGRHAKAAGTGQDKAENLEYDDGIENWKAPDSNRRVRIIDSETGVEREWRGPEDELFQKRHKLSGEAHANFVERTAEKLWGVKGSRFIKMLKEGGPIDAAAKTADISRATAFNWLRKLRELSP
jgi:hypothetical protein